MPSVDIPIISQLVHPSIGLLTVATAFPLGPGPVSGSLSPPQGPLALTYGMRISVITAPADWGLQVGNPNLFDPPFMQVTSAYDTLGGGVRVMVQTELIQIDGTCYFWNEALPVEVLYHLQPGWVVNVEWLQT